MIAASAHRATGLCAKCDKPRKNSGYCLEHDALYRRQKNDRGRQRSYTPRPRDRRWRLCIRDRKVLAHVFEADKPVCGAPESPLPVNPLARFDVRWPRCRACRGIEVAK